MTPRMALGMLVSNDDGTAHENFSMSALLAVARHMVTMDINNSIMSWKVCQYTSGQEGINPLAPGRCGNNLKKHDIKIHNTG